MTVLTIYWNRFLVVLNYFLRDLFLKRNNLVKRARFHESILIYFQNIFFLHEVSLYGPLVSSRLIYFYLFEYLRFCWWAMSPLLTMHCDLWSGNFSTPCFWRLFFFVILSRGALKLSRRIITSWPMFKTTESFQKMLGILWHVIAQLAFKFYFSCLWAALSILTECTSNALTTNGKVP